MPLLGSEEAGIGSVLTAAGGTAGGSSDGGAGIVGTFSAVNGSTDDPTTVYMDNAASVGGGSAVPLQYPAPAMTITGLRLSAPVGTSSNPPTATLYKNGAPTAITCTLPAGAPAGTTVADTSHSVTFAAGDTFDVQLTQEAGGDGPAPYSATLHGSGTGGGGGGGGFPGYGPAPPAVAASSDAGVATTVSRSDHTHAAGAGTLAARVLAASNITLSGPQTIDGVAVVAGNTVLVNGQTSAAQNGLYTVAAGAWSRLSTFATAGQMLAGINVSVTEGTLYADSLWMFATTGTIVVGTTALSFASIGPSFGPDTRVYLPNSAATLVQALQMLTTLPVDTPGAETAVLTFKTMLAGAITDALILNANVVQLPPGWFFRNDTNTGIQWQGADNFALYCGNQPVGVWTTGGLTLNAGIGAFLSWGATHGYVHYNSLNGRTTVSPADGQGNTQIGLGNGAALATSANAGFAAVQSCAGTPTGAPTSTTGFVPIVVDTANNKLYGFYGAAWHSLSP